MKITSLIAGILLLQLLVWLFVLRWIKKKNVSLIKKMSSQCRTANHRVVIEPTSALFRGSDAKFGNIKGNGIICLTEDSLFFEKLTGQKIKLKRAEITNAAVEEWFKGKPSFATGGKHLVIKTTDGNRIGFLVRDTDMWVNKIKSL
ncbi:MAG: hypothetical protein A2010_18685 [Nitrospirae bacterium GWD2_57_9]|nr:MAG: hypothetical protein A2010_18685 [Nitrospirae bacterium GWD2_57_9]OGW50543.1 MAG: hypothetical protein A2078_10885 [Nitrospirae bacterium GWC2_57_9]